MADAPDDRLLTEVEEVAVSAAKGAGEILTRYFGRLDDVGYKDERKTDPVTRADTETEEYVAGVVRERFPGHGVLGEEGTGDDDSPAPDFVWAVDPLDGTNDFVGGLPIFASSIGVLYRGVPVAGAVYVPWPGAATGRVFHARRGGGAFAGRRQADAPDGRGRRRQARGGAGLVPERLPGRQGSSGPDRGGTHAREHRLRARDGRGRRAPVRRSCGRTSLWDCAAGAAILAEAGADVRVGRWVPRTWPMASRLRLDRAAALVDWTGEPSLAGLRKWKAPLIAGRPDIVPGLAAAITPRRRLRRLRRR